MDSSQPKSESVVVAKRHLREAILDLKPQIIGEILDKHPELVNHEYEEEDGYSGTPLLITCDRFKMSGRFGPEQDLGTPCAKQ